jgi:hypothetical protein
MFQVFQMFQRYVASVLYQYCKNRSGCCTCCCNDYTRMFQVFSCVCCKCFHLDVAMFAMVRQVFLSFFWCFASVSDVCCKYFRCFRCMSQVFHLNIANVDRMLHMWNMTHLSQVLGCHRPGRRSSRAVERGRHPSDAGLVRAHETSRCGKRASMRACLSERPSPSISAQTN